MWYRIFLPELLPDVDRVLYLDVDTLAMDSLEPLWATDLGGNYLAARDQRVRGAGSATAPPSSGWPGREAYFNSGVLLLNLDADAPRRPRRRAREFAAEQGRGCCGPTRTR